MSAQDLVDVLNRIPRFSARTHRLGLEVCVTPPGATEPFGPYLWRVTPDELERYRAHVYRALRPVLGPKIHTYGPLAGEIEELLLSTEEVGEIVLVRNSLRIRPYVDR